MADLDRNRNRDTGNGGMLWGALAVLALLAIGGLIYTSSSSDETAAIPGPTTTGTTTGFGAGGNATGTGGGPAGSGFQRP